VNVLSLFSGIGGLELGLERAGMTTVGQVEIDPFCRSVLDKHWPEVPKHDDVRTTGNWWTGQSRPRVDLVAGGFPCQGHSVAGKQRGTEDERWGWPWFRSVIEALNPPLILVENVPNLTRTGLRDVLEDLANRGFDAWWVRVPAAAVGAPHLRWRLFTIAAHPERVQLRIEPGRSGWTRGQGASVVGHDGATWSLADAAGVHGRAGRSGRLALRRDARNDQSSARLVDGETRGRLAGAAWAVEPDVGRVVDGLSVGMDQDIHESRLRALGNAVVPQVAEYIGRLILASVEAPSNTGAA
jgi:DNA (cytosine-5)-methyltransferase 1